LALNILHYQVRFRPFLTDIKHCDDSGVRETTGRPGFHNETLAIFPFRDWVHSSDRNRLYCYDTVEFWIACAIHDPHGPTSNFGGDLIAA
jgi:hypothetical protein